jgi:CheY-like chemotaxis protein
MEDKVVLLIDDNPDDRAISTSILVHYGYQVLTAPTGERGLEMAEQHRPHIILLDMGLPDLDGVAVALRLKAQPETREIPIVAITAYHERYNDPGIRAIGCAAYLRKPMLPRDLVREIDRLLSPHAEQALKAV